MSVWVQNAWARPIVGALLGSVVAFAAYRARALTRSGFVAAAITGTIAVAAGWSWAAVLVGYFASSTLLSRLGAERKRARLAGMVDKPGARDASQVMANGFPFLFCALLAVFGAIPEPLRLMTLATGSLAASAADTWATEIGTMVGQTPRSILTWQVMTVGESGGVTLVGSLASLAGAAFVGAVAVLAGVSAGAFPLIVLGGITGAVADSFLGATVQRRSWCDTCGRATEMRVHDCGTVPRHVAGIAWLENDAVNLVATVTGALVPWLLMPFIAQSPVRQ